MKTLILTDATFEAMTGALNETHVGRAVLEHFERSLELPSDRELIALARSDAEAPAAFARARANRDAAIEAAETTRLAMNELILHAHGAGVGVAVLSRWFGLQPRRIYEIIEAVAA